MVDDVVYIHDQIIQSTGGLSGIRDKGQLEACIARPSQSAFGQDIFDDLFMKSAALLECISNTHPFVDGNKRSAMAASILFLQIHGIIVEFSNEEYEKFMLEVVNKRLSVNAIKQWLMFHGDIAS